MGGFALRARSMLLIVVILAGSSRGMNATRSYSAPAPVSSALPVSAAVHHARWQTLTRQAVRAFEEGRSGWARQLYEEALSEADGIIAAALLLPTEEVTRLAPVLYDTSCRHVAELARHQQDPETEGIFLYRAYERLVQLEERADAPIALRSSCARYLPVALDALVEYLSSQGASALASRHTERAETAALEVERVVGVAAAQQSSATTGIRKRSDFQPG